MNTVDRMQCYLNTRFRNDFVECRSPFRWGWRLVYSDFGGRERIVPSNTLSYSPFPSGLNLNAIASTPVANPGDASSEVTITLKEPLAHLHRDLEFAIDLKDFVVNRVARLCWLGPHRRV